MCCSVYVQVFNCVCTVVAVRGIVHHVCGVSTCCEFTGIAMFVRVSVCTSFGVCLGCENVCIHLHVHIYMCLFVAVCALSPGTCHCMCVCASV